MRKQYSFRPGEVGLDAWDVDRLTSLTAGRPTEDVPLEDIAELDESYWYDKDTAPTVRSVAEHVALVLAVDTQYPIVLAPDGRVMDGMHRVVRALVDGRRSIRAVRLTELPPPDFHDCRPEDLPYDT